jgi:hypothetical protein
MNNYDYDERLWNAEDDEVHYDMITHNVHNKTAANVSIEKNVAQVVVAMYIRYMPFSNVETLVAFLGGFTLISVIGA